MIDTSMYKEYLSPKHKLLHIFENGRDRWREKCKTAKAKLKIEKIRSRRFKEQRDRWSARVHELEAQISELQQVTTTPVTLDR